MIRTQVQLDEFQYRKLKELAARRSQSVSQLVREGVERVLTEAEHQEQWKRLLAVVGTCHDPEGESDVARRHDEHLKEVFGR
ncbi:MAG TPA: ribbon-helix-helix protein, CopG family [Vicinamibacteria bacterium]|jgi:Arc/MetJ-type ribon-helix-helix transcriptional regulator